MGKDAISPEGGRTALLIAAGEYQDSNLRRLRAPTIDVSALGEVLGDPTIGNFDVHPPLVNASAAVTREHIDDFLADRRPDDLLFLYFSCHGIVDANGRLYFASTDTRRDRLPSTATPAIFVADLMRDCRSRRIILALDCCHSGAFARGLIAKGDNAVGLERRFEGRGHVILTASNEFEYAFEGDEVMDMGPEPSLFTNALIHGLRTGEADRDGDQRISVDELYDYVGDRVAEATPHQTPGKWTFDVRGKIYVATTSRVKSKRETRFPALFPGIEQRQDNAQVILRSAVPGINTEHVEIELRGETLVLAVHGETASASVPADVAADKAKATYEDGVLTITLPRIGPLQ